MSTVIATVISTVTGTVTGTLVSDGGGPIFWVPNLDGTAYGKFTDVWSPTGVGSTLSITLVYLPDGSKVQILDGDASAFSLNLSDTGVISFALLTSVEVDGDSATSGVTVLTEGYHTITGTLPAAADVQFLAATSLLADQFQSQIHEIILTDPVTPANSVLIDTCLRSSTMPEVVDVYSFDGTTSYATFSDWVPNGLPFSVEAKIIPLTIDGSTRAVASGNIISDNFLRLDANGIWRNSVRAIDGSANPSGGIVGSEPSVGEAWIIGLESTGAVGQRAFANEVERIDLSSPSDVPNVVLHSIGVASTNAVQFFHGPIWGLKLTDNSPIQDTDACMGDGTRYGQLLQPINLAGDFEIEFDWIRQDRTGNSRYSILGEEVADSWIWVFDSTHSTEPSRVQFRINNTNRIWDLAISDIALGQHSSMRFVRINTTVTLFVDGIEIGDNVASGTFTITRIGNNNQNDLYPLNCAIQNIVIQDLTQSLTYTFPLDEGSGTVINNTDPTTGPAYNGNWTPDVDWQNIPDNSRVYDMHEGSGATFVCVDGTDTPQPALDATIQNFDAAGWSSITTFPGSTPPVLTGIQNTIDDSSYGVWFGLSVTQPYVPKILGGGLDGSYETNKSQVYAGDYAAGAWVLGVDSVTVKAISSGETDGKVGSVYPAVIAAENDIGVAANGSVVKFDGTVASTYGRGYGLLQGDDAKVQAGFEYPNVWRLITSADTSGEWEYFNEGGTAPWPGPIEGDAFLGVFNASLEGFTFTRSSSAWGIAEDGIIYESVAGEPVYPGCGNDGAGNWLPDVGFKGLLLEGGGENFCEAPTDLLDPLWVGNTIKTIRTSPEISEIIQNHPVHHVASSALNQQQTATYFNPTPPVIGVDLQATQTILFHAAEKQWAYNKLRAFESPNKTRALWMDMGVPDIYGASGRSIAYFEELYDDWFLTVVTAEDGVDSADPEIQQILLAPLESRENNSTAWQGNGIDGIYVGAVQHEYFPFATSLMLNGPRAATNCTQTLANMSLPDLVNDFTVQIKLEQIADRTFYQGVGNVVLFDIAESANNRLTCYYDTATDNVIAQKTVGGVAGTGAVANIGAKLRGEPIDIAVVADAVDGLYIYVGGVLIQNQPGETADFGTALSDCYLGNDYAGAGNHFDIVKELNVWDDVVTPAQVRGIHLFGAAAFTQQ